MDDFPPNDASLSSIDQLDSSTLPHFGACDEPSMQHDRKHLQRRLLPHDATTKRDEQRPLLLLNLNDENGVHRDDG